VGVTTMEELTGYLRCARGFDAAAVLEVKLDRIAQWFADEQLDAAVVGVSGGIDSAVVLALLGRVASRPDAPLRRVVGLVAPIDRPGATGQDQAAQRGVEVVEAVGAELWSAPLGAVQDEAVAALEGAAGATLDAWTAGQLLSVVRTPVLYGAAALLQAAGHRSVVVGTTNRDEGAYLGFFGKASDGMVDLQPISDLHKSEVRALARLLAVPASVLAAPPAGDVWDGRTDADMIGASYDEIEVVLRLRELGQDPVLVARDLADGDRLVAASEAVERLHETNAHKYRVGSPSVHLDVLPRGVPGGWTDTALAGRDEQRPPAGQLPGEWEPAGVTLSSPPRLPDARSVRGTTGQVVGLFAPSVLDADDCAHLVEAMAAHAPLQPVSVTGHRSGDRRGPERTVGDEPVAGLGAATAGIGSDRGTAWAPALAAELWARVRPLVPSVRVLRPCDATDGFATGARAGHRAWRAVGLGPVLRFMRYRPGGRHLCHYDAGFDYGDGRRSLVSLVLFLTDRDDRASGGATRFVRDGQEHLPVWERVHDDWARDTEPDEVIAAVAPSRGGVLLFDHRQCHDVERWHGPGDRVIVRGDVVYEAIPDGRPFP
jgi:NAD+ synthetase